VTHPDFKLEIVNLIKGETIIHQSIKPFSILNLNGKIKLNVKTFDAYQAFFIKNENELIIEALEDGSYLVID
jgi:hypothetical protein